MTGWWQGKGGRGWWYRNRVITSLLFLCYDTNLHERKEKKHAKKCRNDMKCHLSLFNYAEIQFFNYLGLSLVSQIKLRIFLSQISRSIPINFWEDFRWVSADIGLFILFAISYNITAIYDNCERKQETLMARKPLDNQ